jgi:hypothetical protein
MLQVFQEVEGTRVTKVDDGRRQKKKEGREMKNATERRAPKRFEEYG